MVAGGHGSRFGGGTSKVFALVDGRPLLWYPLEAAAHIPQPVRIVIVIRREDRDQAQALSESFTSLNLALVEGGATRHESERAGLERLAASVAGDELIGIHDGARPFLTVDLWQACVGAARETGGAVPVMESGPLFRFESDCLQSFALAAHRAQTPQVFRADLLLAAFQIPFPSAPDTAAVVMRDPTQQVAAVPGDPHNIKVTFPRDLERAERLARLWARGRWSAV